MSRIPVEFDFMREEGLEGVVLPPKKNSDLACLESPFQGHTQTNSYRTLMVVYWTYHVFILFGFNPGSWTGHDMFPSLKYQGIIGAQDYLSNF